MASNRIGRINEEIQRELAELIRSLKDPRVQTLISITRVDTTPDLRYSKIYISVMDEEKQKDAEQSQRQEANRLSREVLQEEGLLAGREKQGSARKHRENAPKTSEWRPQNTRYFSQEGQRRIKGEGGS